jgi:hypothetical protein
VRCSYAFDLSGWSRRTSPRLPVSPNTRIGDYEDGLSAGVLAPCGLIDVRRRFRGACRPRRHGGKPHTRNRLRCLAVTMQAASTASTGLRGATAHKTAILIMRLSPWLLSLEVTVLLLVLKNRVVITCGEWWRSSLRFYVGFGWR